VTRIGTTSRTHLPGRAILCTSQAQYNIWVHVFLVRGMLIPMPLVLPTWLRYNAGCGRALRVLVRKIVEALF